MAVQTTWDDTGPTESFYVISPQIVVACRDSAETQNTERGKDLGSEVDRRGQESVEKAALRFISVLEYEAK